MRLLNPRLLQQAGSARGYLAVTVALGLAGAVLILVQADLLSRDGGSAHDAPHHPRPRRARPGHHARKREDR
jgi:hypothetical protein